MKKDHPDLSLRRQCSLLSLARSTLYYQPRGESAENLKFMEIIHCPAGDLQMQICREGTSSSWRRRGMGLDKWPTTCSGRATDVGDIVCGG